jgi:SAM-dependent methyltransferase
VDEQSGTWHYGLIARWWAEFNKAEPHELDYYRSAVRKFGEPVVDLGCGTGRFLVPLAADGFDIDGVDISADMIAAARAQLSKSRTAQLSVQSLHDLHLDRTYRTAYMCGVLGIGGRRDHDREALLRAYEHLEPGGALLIVHQLPNSDDEKGWADWLPGHRAGYPPPWPDEGNRRRTADGDEIELLSRVAEFDPLQQQLVLAMRARLWRGGSVVNEEAYKLKSCVYFAQEIVLMLADAGFRDVAIEGNYTGLPATGDDTHVIFVARR